MNYFEFFSCVLLLLPLFSVRLSSNDIRLVNLGPRMSSYDIYLRRLLADGEGTGELRRFELVLSYIKNMRVNGSTAAEASKCLRMVCSLLCFAGKKYCRSKLWSCQLRNNALWTSAAAGKLPNTRRRRQRLKEKFVIVEACAKGSRGHTLHPQISLLAPCPNIRVILSLSARGKQRANGEGQKGTSSS